MTRLALFGHGFRPFFLLSGSWAAIAMVLWLISLQGVSLPDGPLHGVRWHAHEMIAGFIGAAMAGFLLTAVPNWTGRRGYAGAPVIGLAAVFVAARLALLPGSPLPVPVAAVIGLLPMPALLLIILPALLAARTPRLFGPPALILLFWVADLLMLGEAAAWFADSWATGQRLALNAALLLVGLIGGRIVPAFTLNALRRAGQPQELRPLRGVDAGALAALAAVLLVDLVQPDGVLSGIVAAVAAVLVALRLSRWHGLRTGFEPLLWVLHVAYGMVVVALGLKAAALVLHQDWAAAWLHMQSVGAVALMILAVMTRATLGHTGRDLTASRPVAVAYGLLLAAALARVFGGLLAPPGAALTAAGLLWLGAFLIFLAEFGPMLLRPRPDGKEG